MRWVGMVLGLSAVHLGCATSDSGVGGVGAGGFVGGTGGLEGGLGGSGGSVGGSAGVATGGTGGGTGGAAGGGGTATGGSAGTPAGGAGGGTGGGPCTPPVAGGLCDTFPQCGCPNGQACDVVTVAGITQCVVAGNVPPYNACDGTNTKCQAGYACVGGACKSFCDTPATCNGSDCLQVTYDNAGTPTPIPGMKICSKQCALENPGAACGPTLGCFISDQAAGKTDCATGGLGIGAVNCTAVPATPSSTCAPAYVCLTSGECRKWCRVGVAGDCAAGKSCTAFAAPNQIFIGPTEYGVCSL
jgi:hypothetical protein